MNKEKDNIGWIKELVELHILPIKDSIKRRGILVEMTDIEPDRYLRNVVYEYLREEYMIGKSLVFDIEVLPYKEITEQLGVLSQILEAEIDGYLELDDNDVDWLTVDSPTLDHLKKAAPLLIDIIHLALERLLILYDIIGKDDDDDGEISKLKLKEVEDNFIPVIHTSVRLERIVESLNTRYCTPHFTLSPWKRSQLDNCVGIAKQARQFSSLCGIAEHHEPGNPTPKLLYYSIFVTCVFNNYHLALLHYQSMIDHFDLNSSSNNNNNNNNDYNFDKLTCLYLITKDLVDFKWYEKAYQLLSTYFKLRQQYPLDNHLENQLNAKAIVCKELNKLDEAIDSYNQLLVCPSLVNQTLSNYIINLSTIIFDMADTYQLMNQQHHQLYECYFTISHLSQIILQHPNSLLKENDFINIQSIYNKSTTLLRLNNNNNNIDFNNIDLNNFNNLNLKNIIEKGKEKIQILLPYGSNPLADQIWDRCTTTITQKQRRWESMDHYLSNDIDHVTPKHWDNVNDYILSFQQNVYIYSLLKYQKNNNHSQESIENQDQIVNRIFNQLKMENQIKELKEKKVEMVNDKEIEEKLLNSYDKLVGAPERNKYMAEYYKITKEWTKLIQYAELYLEEMRKSKDDDDLFDRIMYHVYVGYFTRDADAAITYLERICETHLTQFNLVLFDRYFHTLCILIKFTSKFRERLEKGLEYIIIEQQQQPIINQSFNQSIEINSTLKEDIDYNQGVVTITDKVDKLDIDIIDDDRLPNIQDSNQYNEIINNIVPNGTWPRLSKDSILNSRLFKRAIDSLIIQSKFDELENFIEITIEPHNSNHQFNDIAYHMTRKFHQLQQQNKKNNRQFKPLIVQDINDDDDEKENRYPLSLSSMDAERSVLLCTLLANKFTLKYQPKFTMDSDIDMKKVRKMAKLYNTIYYIFIDRGVLIIDAEKPKNIIVELPDSHRLNYNIVNSRFPFQRLKIDLKNLASTIQQCKDFVESLKDWYKWLIEPAESFLPLDRPTCTITFISGESFSNIPFVALIDGNGKYLIEKYPIATAPSLSSLLLLSKKKKIMDKSYKREMIQAIAIGNPVGSGLKLAEKECIMIKDLMDLKEIPNTVHTNSDATIVNTLKGLKDSTYSHIACHGDSQFHLYPQSLFQGRLVMTQDSNGIKSYVYGDDIIKERLENCRLVFMSCCFSGRGRSLKSGVIGLMWALHCAGALSTIGCHWELPESSNTVDFVKTFYSYLFDGQNGGGSSLSLSLQMAMIDAIKKERNFIEKGKEIGSIGPKNGPHKWSPLFISGLNFIHPTKIINKLIT